VSRMSRQKGARGEREWRDVLREEGFLKAYRGQQFCGIGDAPDVVCPELPDIWMEVKRTESISLPDWLAQVEKDAGSKLPVIAHKKNRMADWVVIMPRQAFFRLLRESSFVAPCVGNPLPTTTTAEKGTTE
jgi:Holliday junction resolvase